MLHPLPMPLPVHQPSTLAGIAAVVIVLGSIPTATANESNPRFNVEVMAAISKAGCNAGVCHGNQNGKGGFKLSLRGQDPDFDYHSLTRAESGRRINLLDAERSLILDKPSGRLPHLGGRRLPFESAPYDTLRTWIANGAPGPDDKTPRVVDLRVTPNEAVVWTPNDVLQLKVEAEFSNGVRSDVTEWAVYEPSNFRVAEEGGGRLVRREFGEATVIVRYLDQQKPVAVAFLENRETSWPRLHPNNVLDRAVYGKLKRLRTPPSEPCSDHVFIRRVYLDALGELPDRATAQAFVAETAPDKRTRLVDRVLANPAFADHWALKWSDVLRNEEKVLDKRGVSAFHSWIRESILRGEPVDSFVRQLVLGKGSSYKSPAANYYRANRSPSMRGETTARLFLGVRLQCAKCHNHPFDRWSQDDYYSWASVFAGVDYKIVENKRRDKFDKNEFIGEQVILHKDSGVVTNQRTGSPAKPRLLGAGFVDDKGNRLDQMAQWLTSAENTLFVQSQANWVWYQLMGRGIVEPVDDFRLTNPPGNAALMETLSNEFVRREFDLRSLVRLIMTSRTYQASSTPNAWNEHDTTNYARNGIRRLTAEQLLDAQSQVLGEPATFAGYTSGVRAGQIEGVRRVRVRDKRPTSGDRFLTTFGKPKRLLACECERSDETTLNQALELVAGEALHESLESPTNRLAELAASSLSDTELVEELFWSALSRSPSPAELTASLGSLEQADQRLSGLRDLAWALLNAKEFVFRH